MSNRIFFKTAAQSIQKTIFGLRTHIVATFRTLPNPNISLRTRDNEVRKRAGDYTILKIQMPFKSSARFLMNWAVFISKSEPAVVLHIGLVCDCVCMREREYHFSLVEFNICMLCYNKRATNWVITRMKWRFKIIKLFFCGIQPITQIHIMHMKKEKEKMTKSIQQNQAYWYYKRMCVFVSI